MAGHGILLWDTLCDSVPGRVALPSAVPLHMAVRHQYLSTECALGCVQVEVDEQVVTVLKKGSYFGEIGLLRACRRTASIRAVSETVDLFVLSKVTLANSASLALLELRVHSIRQEAALRPGRVSF